jgi:hypothetical protein
MKPVPYDQVLPFEQWERMRPLLRPLFIQEKERRRQAVGPHLTLLFENVQTVWYQVEEMLRSERTVNPHLIQEELDVYNALLPRTGELSATLFIEYAEAPVRDEALRKLVGLEDHLWLQLGDERIKGRFDAEQIGDGQISAVQFVRFTPGVAGDRLVVLADAGKVSVAFDHPFLNVTEPVGGVIARALAEDLRADGG